MFLIFIVSNNNDVPHRHRMSLFAFLLAEKTQQPAVVFLDLAHHKKSIDGQCAIGDDTGNKLPLGRFLTLDENVAPELFYFLAITVKLAAQFLFSLLHLLQGSIMTSGIGCSHSEQ